MQISVLVGAVDSVSDHHPLEPEFESHSSLPFFQIDQDMIYMTSFKGSATIQRVTQPVIILRLFQVVVQQNKNH